MITMTNSREWITNGAPIQSSYPVHLTKEGKVSFTFFFLYSFSYQFALLPIIFGNLYFQIKDLNSVMKNSNKLV